MSYKTWTVKVSETKTVDVRGPKTLAEEFGRAVSKVRQTQSGKYVREICGVYGCSPDQSVLWYPFGGAAGAVIDHQENFEKDLSEYLEALPAVIVVTEDETPENSELLRHIRAAGVLFGKYVPTLDKRRTEEEVAKQNEELEAAHKEHAEKLAAWKAEHCGPDTEVPSGSMGIYLRRVFDDSNVMTDYFNMHAGLDPSELLVAIMPKQRQTERLMRSVVARYPELAGLSWTWHTENYSGGHGNYLMSEHVGTEKHKAYDGRSEVSWWYEVALGYGSNRWTYKNYPGTVAASETPAPGGNGDGKATVSLNAEREGVEVRFDSKPAREVLDRLHGAGFRWSGRQGLWWARQSNAEAMTVAESLRA